MKYWLTIRQPGESGELAWIRYQEKPNYAKEKAWLEISETTFNFLMNFVMMPQRYYTYCWTLLE